MKTIVRVVSILFTMGIVTAFGIIPASAQTSGPSASGIYKFSLDDDLLKSVEFNATSDERGTTTGQMTFKDEAVIVEQDVDGVGLKEGSQSQFYMTAKLDSLTIEGSRALMGGTVKDSSNSSYIGRWVQLVVEDNGNERDRLTWCFCQPEEGGWVPADAEVPGDEGAWWKWWATDFEVKDDKGVQSANIIPGNKTSCKALPLSVYPFADVKSGEGQIQVQP